MQTFCHLQGLDMAGRWPPPPVCHPSGPTDRNLSRILDSLSEGAFIYYVITQGQGASLLDTESVPPIQDWLTEKLDYPKCFLVLLLDLFEWWIKYFNI